MNKVKQEDKSLPTEEEDYDSGVAEYSPKSEFSKPRVVENAVVDCYKARAKGMNAGYYNTKLTRDGNPIRVWIEDERKVFIGAVDGLFSMLIPELEEDSEFDNLPKELEEAKKELFDKYCYTPIIKRTVNGKVIWVKTGEDAYIPKADQPIPINDSKYPHSDRIELMPGFWNSKVNGYWDGMVKVYDELFQELNRLIHSKNYFKQTTQW